MNKRWLLALFALCCTGLTAQEGDNSEPTQDVAVTDPVSANDDVDSRDNSGSGGDNGGDGGSGEHGREND